MADVKTTNDVSESNGFMLPQADDPLEQTANTEAQTMQPVGLAPVHEDVGARDLMIGAGVIVVLLIAFFFAKQGFTNSLVKKRISPGKAGMAGWWLFIFLSSIAIASVLAAVNPAKFLTMIVLAPLGVVAVVSGFLAFTSSRA